MTEQPPIDSSEIMTRIREAIRHREVSSGLSSTEFQAIASGAPSKPGLADLRRDLERLMEATQYNSVEMMLSDVRPSPISRFVQRLRGALHEAILFYVNRLAAQQAVTNALTVRTLQSALALIEAQDARIAELEHKSDPG